jgi:macrolide-specific efflux system membrane fusion protein
VLTIIALAVALAVTGVGVRWFAVRQSASAAQAAPTTQTVAASLSTMEKTVTSSGTIAPTVQEDVSFLGSGVVTSVLVAAGQTVTAGQALATIDTLTLNADLLQARATLAQVKATHADAVDAADGSDASDAQIAAAAAQIDVAQAAADAAQAAMEGATLTAPVAGLVTQVGVVVGDGVTGSSATTGSSGAAVGASAGGSSAGAGASTGAASTSSAAFTIVGTDSWKVDATVDDGDVGLIAAGDQAEITLTGATATIFGTVSEIGLISTSSSGVASYPVTIAITGKPAGVYDGVSADVSIIYERRTDVLTVPSAAVRTVDGASVVTQAAADGTEVSTPVTVGDTVGQLTEITSGLAEGDEVLVRVVQQTTQQVTGTQDTGTRGQVPGGFTPGQLPEGFDPNQLPQRPTDG